VISNNLFAIMDFSVNFEPSSSSNTFLPMKRSFLRSLFSLTSATTAAFALCWSGNVSATNIGIDLGSAPAIITHTSTGFNNLNGTALTGQTLSLDFTFTTGEFVRLFTVTSFSFASLLDLRTDAGAFVGFADGTGYLVDQNGNPLITPQSLGSASGDNGSMHMDLFPFFSGELGRPADFFGVHFDLTLPSDPSAVIIGGRFRLSSDPDQVFGIGPGVPRDIVPDVGNPLLLLALSVTAVAAVRRVVRPA
jgi:hypothetical protein